MMDFRVIWSFQLGGILDFFQKMNSFESILPKDTIPTSMATGRKSLFQEDGCLQLGHFFIALLEYQCRQVTRYHPETDGETVQP